MSGPSRTAAIHIRRHGGPEVLEPVSVALTGPGPGEVRLRQTAIGLNFSDVYERAGRHGPHRPKPFPITLGTVGAGSVEAVGDGVTGVAPGDLVACIAPGAYQAERNVPAGTVLRLPRHVNPEAAAATLLRGLTADYLVHRLYAVRPGDTVLVHAAAGGMGSVLCPWSRALGATVIGTVGSGSKVPAARDHGCHHVVDLQADDLVSRVRELTDGRGVGVVYDAVGRDVFLPSLDCLRPMGLLVSYGTASGDVEAFDLQRLHARSLSVCRPTLRTFIADPRDLRQSADRFFAAAARGDVPLSVGARYALADVRRAHADLEGRRTTGSPVLLV